MKLFTVFAKHHWDGRIIVQFRATAVENDMVFMELFLLFLKIMFKNSIHKKIIKLNQMQKSF